MFYFLFVLFRGRRFRYTCKIETGLSSRYAKLCHVLAYLWFHNIQVLPCPFTGNEPSFDSHFFLFNFPCCFFPGLAAQSVLVFFEFFASASCKQLVFVSVDNLHDLHGKPWKTRLHFKLKDSKKNLLHYIQLKETKSKLQLVKRLEDFFKIFCSLFVGFLGWLM